jgi:membrane-associated phospholipid phosphatase
MMLKLFSRNSRPARMQLIFSAFCFTCFGIVAWQVVNHLSITEFDFRQAIRFYEFSSSHPAIRKIALWITDAGSGRPRQVVVAAVAVILLIQRKWRLAVFWTIVQCLERELIVDAKNAFERPRPDYPEATTLASGWAFPSGHAMGVMVTYGMLAYLLALHWRRRWLCWPAVGLICLFILLVGLSRMLLGVHWFSDVLGGYLLGLAFISLCGAIVEWTNQLSLRRSRSNVSRGG